jgi:glyoxylase-like metal-dependent hydrolase (beta-lactamase superfamily II)
VIRGETAGAPPVLLDFEQEIIATLPPIPPAPPVPGVVEVADGDVLGFGGGAVVVAVPGHTDGSIAIHLPVPGVLFTGDAVANVEGRTMLGVFNTDRARAVESFHRLAALEVETVVFGHGDPVVGDASAVLRAAAGQQIEG